MPSRKLVHPSGNKQDRRPEYKGQVAFDDVYEDEPANTIPDGSFAKCINAIPKHNNGEPRNGSTLFTDVPMPPIDGRTGYFAHKENDIIVSDSGNIFTEADVSNLWGWENGLYDEIIEYISPSRVRSRDSDYNAGSGFLRGRINLFEWHSRSEAYIFQLGNDFYVTDREITVFTKVIIFSRDTPANVFSEYIEFDDDCLINNSNGLYKIILTENPPRAYRINTDIPSEKVESNYSDGKIKHQYRYFYSVAIIQAAGNFGNRNTPAKILTESGLNEYKFNDVDEGDWSIVNTEKPIGVSSPTYGVLTGGPGIDTDAATWSAINDATIMMQINGLGYANIVLDFSSVVTMDNLAGVIQVGLQRYFPSATCEYIADGGAPRLQITSGKEDQGSISYAVEGVGGTPSSTTLMLTAGSGAEITSEQIYSPNIVRGLSVPLYNGVAGNYQWHWNRYCIYRTPDYGDSGYHIDAKTGKQLSNSPDFIVWAKDLRIAGSFIARRINGIIEVMAGQYGEFEEADEGDVIEFEDSSRFEIVEYLTGKMVRYTTTPYYNDSSGWQAAWIGNGRGARVRKAGRVVTVYAGTTFTSADERKPIYWPNGNISYIREVTSINTFTTWDDIEWDDDSAITLDPVWRNFTDRTNDDVLYGNSSNWTAKSRLFFPVEISNLISAQPGFVLTAARGGKEIRYCQTELSYRQFLGYHNRDFQKIILEDKILALHDFPDRYSALCQGSIYTGVTNNSVELTIQGTLQLVFQLNDPEKVADFGILNKGSIQKIGRGYIRFVTNINEIVDFDGINYGSDLTVDANGLRKFKKAVENAVVSFNSLYSRVTGYLIWWKKNE